MSRLDQVLITFFDPSKIQRYNMRVNMYFGTKFGVKMSFNIMKWSERMLASCCNMRMICKMIQYRLRLVLEFLSDYIISYDSYFIQMCRFEYIF